MLYQGTIGRQVNVAGPGGDNFLYFGPLRRPDIVRAILFHIGDEVGTLSLALRLGIAVFSGSGRPVSNRAVFAAGRHLVGEFGVVMVAGIPTTELAIGTEHASVSLPINLAIEDGDHFFGVFLNNPGANARGGLVFIDTDIGDHQGRKEVL